MDNIRNTIELKAAIAELKIRQATDLFLLKEEIRITKDKFKLSNIIKSGFKKITSSPNMSSNLVNTALGLTTGFLTKKIMIGRTINPLKKLFGAALEMFVAKKVVDNADSLKTVGSVLLNKIIPNKENNMAVDH